MSVCGLPDVSAVSTFYEMDGIDYQVLNIVDYIMHITHPWADFPMVEIRAVSYTHLTLPTTPYV